MRKTASNTIVVLFTILIMMLITVSMTYCGERAPNKSRSDYKTEQYQHFNIHSLKDLKYSTRIVIDELKSDE